MKKIVSFAAVFLATVVFAGNLTFESGSIKAHTEVFGDSSIDSTAKKATSYLSMDAAPVTLKGSIEVSMSDLVSDNKKRDASMQETLESSTFPKAVFEVKEVVAKGGDNVILKGSMNLHGVTKPMSFEGTVSEEASKVHIKVKSSMKMSDFGITPPKMVFLSVRDQVDLSVDMVLKR
jgi:polyisoprenoid-binding protein YceI